MQHEPTRLEIILTKLAFSFCGKQVYKNFADSLPLYGGEDVLDFGCGMGTVAYYTVKRLPYGSLNCFDISKRWLYECKKTLCGFDNVSFLTNSDALCENKFDIIYCHFVLHDIKESELPETLPTLVKSLKNGGKFIFREPLEASEKLSLIKRLLEQSGMTLKDSRITDVPFLGNTLESMYIK